jgi:CRISPR-associated protein Csb2
VTPAALPEGAKRRRIEPTRLREEAKRGAERRSEQEQAAGAVVQALRHAEVQGHPMSIRAQREPFEAHGERVEAFSPGTRFPKERLWHVEITFEEPVTGSLVIGDGRYCGLGLMAPLQT